MATIKERLATLETQQVDYHKRVEFLRRNKYDVNRQNLLDTSLHAR